MRSDDGAPPRPPGDIACLVTCEHGGNRIPSPYGRLFRSHATLLASHRGYDPGALAMARSLARAFDARLMTSTVSRLLVELNRSPGRQFRHSPVMRHATREVREDVCRRYYTPHWTAAETFVHDAIRRERRVLHISSHSFTPSLDGDVRRTDIGLLYDPGRESERSLCVAWQAALTKRLPCWTTRRNYPYRGTGDGLTRYLRTQFDDASYCGIELEINQKHVRNGGAIARNDRVHVVAALLEGLAVSWTSPSGCR
jgi:predicted N-formylglutamate amidohydrolase